MKKIYEKPFAEKLVFDSRDIVTAQSGRKPTDKLETECEMFNKNYPFHPDLCDKIHDHNI